MAKKGRIHWFGPASMLAALFAGIAFSLGHNFFYDRLDGKELPAVNYTMGQYNSGISRQQSNTAIGTAFAFGCKDLPRAGRLDSLCPVVLEVSGPPIF